MGRRVAELDALRGIAAVIILLFHLNPAQFPPGWTGVDLFFVLSGYLITTIILDHLGTIRFLAVFYARRALRIWPIYYLTLAVLVFTAPLIPADRQPPLKGLGYYLTFCQNLSLYKLIPPPQFHVAFEHTWTLALEEQFYVLWPPLIMLGAWTGWDRLGSLAGRVAVRNGQGRRLVQARRRFAWVLSLGGRTLRLIGVCCVPIVVAWMARAGGYFRLGRYSEFILISRCDGFALGGLMAILLNDRLRVARNLNAYRLGFALVAVLTFLNMAYHCSQDSLIHYIGLPTPADPANTHLMVSLFYFGVVGVVVTLAGHPLMAPLRWRPLCDLGLISYGIYLYHYPIYWAVDEYRVAYEHSLWKGAAKLALTLVIAQLSWRFIERPCLSLKSWFRYEGRGEDVRMAPEPVESSTSI